MLLAISISAIILLAGGLLIVALLTARTRLQQRLSAPPTQLEQWQLIDGEVLRAATRILGPQQAQPIERLIHLYAERALRQLAADCATVPAIRSQLDQELTQLDVQIAQLQERIGTAAMLYVRTVIVPAVTPLWSYPTRVVHRRHQLQTTLHSDSSGVTFLAHDLHLQRDVILIMLAPLLDAPIARQILVGARKFAALQSPQIVTLYDCYTHDGLACLVREYVPGQTLRQALDAGEKPALQPIVLDTLQALEDVHSRGLAHGALRPEVILLLDRGAKVCDFGLHWALQHPSISADAPAAMLRYLAPEQLSYEPVTAQSDLYAFGVMLYELAAGQPPFSATEREALIQQQQALPTPPAQLNQHISRSLDYLIIKLLSPRPEQRYSSATEVAQVLLSLEDPFTTREMPLTAQRRPFVGREAELQQLMRRWAAASQSEGQIALIAGEAGIGKSRLLAACAEQAQGATLLMGQAVQEHHQAPYQLFRTLIEAYLATTPAERLQQQLNVSLAPLASLIPALAPYTGPWFEPPASTPAQAQLRLQRSMVHFVELIAQQGPCLLVLEDLHWADPASLEVLRALAPRIVRLPLLILGTYRDLELDETHPLSITLRVLSRLAFFSPLTLSRLDHRGVKQLLDAFWQQPVPTAWGDTIAARTGGNPFYVEEIAKLLVETGRAEYQGGTWHFSELDGISLPEDIRAIVRNRLALTSQPTQELLRLAAILGYQFSADELMVLLNHSETVILQLIDEALGRRLIIEDGRGATFRFYQSEIQQVILEDLTAERRRQLHTQVGRYVEQHRDAESEAETRALAYHFGQARDQQQGVFYSLRAARQAEIVHAYADARRWYAQAFDLLPDTAQATAQRLDISRKLGEIYTLQAAYTEAVEAYEAMARYAEQADDMLAKIQAYNALAFVQERRAAYPASLEHARQASALARKLGDAASGELAAALFYEGWACYRLGDTQRAASLAEEAHMLCIELGAPARRELALSLKLRGALGIGFGHFDQAADYKQQALEIVRDLHDQREEAILLSNLGYLYTKWGKVEQALEFYNQALALARQIDYRAGELLVLCNMAWPKIRLGLYSSAEADIRQVLLLAEPGWFSLADANRALSEAYLGQHKLSEALQAGLQALQLAEHTKRPDVIVAAWRTLGRIADELGEALEIGARTYDARACFAESLRICIEHQLSTEQAQTLQTWSTYELAQGDEERGLQLRTQAHELQSSQMA